MTDPMLITEHAGERSPTEIIDKSGRAVDISGRRWQLNAAGFYSVINWDSLPEMPAWFIEASRQYVVDRIKRKSPSESHNTFKDIRFLAKNLIAFEQEGGQFANEIPYTFFSSLRAKLGTDNAEYRLHRLRAFYMWSADHALEGFSPEIAFELDRLRISGNIKGKAVLSEDPEEGPLTEDEVTALLSRLRTNETASLQERLAVWLCFALGRNPLNFCLLLEEDLRVIETKGVAAKAYELRIPRIKKRLDHERSEFKVQKIEPELAALIAQLITENRVIRPTRGPAWLFRRSTPRPSFDPDSEFAYQFRALEFSILVGDCVDRLGVMSPRTEQPLKVTPRRLRYTFATRLVDEGISQRGLAEALDHTDLQHVLVYFNARSNIVRRIDAAIAMRIGPLAQAFAGHLVDDEDDAVRGNDPASRIFRMNTVQGKLEGVGTCGSFSFCGLGPPIACYTCKKFQPWRSAPHRALMNDLLADREEKLAKGADPKMVKLLDPTIYAIAEVVRRVETNDDEPQPAQEVA
jgi:integrase